MQPTNKYKYKEITWVHGSKSQPEPEPEPAPVVCRLTGIWRSSGILSRANIESDWKWKMLIDRLERVPERDPVGKYEIDWKALNIDRDGGFQGNLILRQKDGKVKKIVVMCLSRVLGLEFKG